VTKAKTIEMLRSYHTTMRNVALLSGMSEKAYDRILPSDIGDMKMNIIQNLLYRLKEIHDTVYTSVLDIKKLRTDEQWKTYELFGGANDFVEIRLLKERKKILKKALMNSSLVKVK
jgi:hypothetical protein